MKNHTNVKSVENRSAKAPISLHILENIQVGYLNEKMNIQAENECYIN